MLSLRPGSLLGRSLVRHGSTSSTGSPPVRLIVLGAPGSGKGTQGLRLMKAFDLSTIGVGDILRQEILSGSEVGVAAGAVMKAGGLLGDEMVLDLIKPALARSKSENYILDGFPRRVRQAELLDGVLSQLGEKLSLVVDLKVPDEVILDRIEQRWVHAPSGRVYNMSFNPPLKAGKDDETGEPLTKRADDTAAVFGKRLANYHAENNPILDYYRRTFPEGLVHCEGRTSDEIWPKLKEIVAERFPGLSR